MKIKNIFLIIAILFVVIMGSFSKNENQDPRGSSGLFSAEQSHNNMKAGVLPAVNLGAAGDFVILSKLRFNNVFISAVTGDIGTSPITVPVLMVNCAEVSGTICTVDTTGPLSYRVTDSTRLTASVGDMLTAYSDAAARLNPNFTNLGDGKIGGKTLTRGLYKWTSGVVIPADITISGGPDDVWIFQVAGNLYMRSGVSIKLAGGAQAKNIFWQSAGTVTLGSNCHFEGIILGQTSINMKKGATINGRMFAKTAVTLQMNTVTQPL